MPGPRARRANTSTWKVQTLAKLRVAVPAVIAAVAFAAGCTSGSPSDRQESSAPPPSLDTGTYATTPRGPFGVVRGDELSVLESQRMADFTTLPREIDNTLTKAGLLNAPLVSEGKIKNLFSDRDKVANVAIRSGLVAGWVGSAKTPNGDASLNHGLMRFAAPDAATKAAQAIADAVQANPVPFLDKLGPPSNRESNAALPGSVVLVDPPQAGDAARVQTTTAITAYRSYLIVDVYSVTLGEADPTDEVLRRSLDLQKPLIDRFPTTPLKGGSVVKDQDKLLIYTIKDAQPLSLSNDGVFGPRGWAFGSDDPLKLIQQLQAAGVKHIADGGTNVYRTATPGQAKTLQQQLADTDTTLSSIWEKETGPAAIPDVMCGGDVNLHICRVAVGRYIGEALQQDPRDAKREIAAQYKILLQADQSAPN